MPHELLGRSLEEEAIDAACLDAGLAAQADTAGAISAFPVVSV